MVFNWKEHIDKCLEQNQIINSFHASAMEKHYQRNLLIKRMLENQWDQNKINEWFEQYDSEYEVYRDDFDYMVKVATKIKWPKERDYHIFITDSELNYINNLHYDKDCKKYLLGIICVGKIMTIKKGLPAFNSRDRSFAWYLATGQDNYRSGSQKNQILKKYFCKFVKDKVLAITPRDKKIKRSDGYHTTLVTNTVLSVNWVDFYATTGTLINDFETDIKKIGDEMITDNISICSKCEIEFVKSLKSKTDLCPECYKEHRKHKEQQRLHEFYQKINSRRKNKPFK